MAYRAYVGNLPFSFLKADLEALFADFGSVKSADIIMDRETGRPRGFGFVEMGTNEELQAAIQGLNGKPVGGRSLTVNEARERDSRGPGGARTFAPRPGGGFAPREGGSPRGPGSGPGRPAFDRGQGGGAGGSGAGAGDSGGRGRGEREPERKPDRAPKRGRGMEDYDRHDKSWRRGKGEWE